MSPPTLHFPSPQAILEIQLSENVSALGLQALLGVANTLYGTHEWLKFAEDSAGNEPVPDLDFTPLAPALLISRLEIGTPNLLTFLGSPEGLTFVASVLTMLGGFTTAATMAYKNLWDARKSKSDIARNAAAAAKASEVAGLQSQLPALTKALQDATAAVSAKQAEIAALSADLDTLVAQVTALNGQIAAKEREILDLQARVAPLMAQLDGLNGEISATETKLRELQAQLTGLDQKLTDANTTLANLQAKKGANKDSIAAQKKTVTGLQDQLGSIQNQIRAIDGQIALGGCVA